MREMEKQVAYFVVVATFDVDDVIFDDDDVTSEVVVTTFDVDDVSLDVVIIALNDVVTFNVDVATSDAIEAISSTSILSSDVFESCTVSVP